MIFHGSSQFPSQAVKQEDNTSTYPFHPYATSTVHNAGATPSNSQFAGTGNQNRGLEYPTAAFSIPNSASSGASYAIAMPLKRDSPGESNGNGPGHGQPVKHIKVEHPEEFSNAVKKRLANSSRTGQACDRCKVRKIRCDGLPGGCSPCLQNNTECRTTDRITGRATSRGYVDSLENDNRNMQNRIRELEQKLLQGGTNPKPSSAYQDAGAASYDYGQSSAGAWAPDASYAPQSLNGLTTGQQEASMFRTLPAFRAGCTGDNYLGVSPGNSNLSAIKGTALSILGMEIDIADFDSPDMNEPDSTQFHPQLYNKSYQAFLQSALNINPRIEKVELPNRASGFMYAEWYFRVINPFMPLLHKPTFMKLLTRMYDDLTCRPTTSETVIVHMVFAIMFFQYAARNWEDTESQVSLSHESNMHYHFSLSKFYQLSCSHTFQDVQALTLICAHLRNFPKPGPSWMFTQTTMALAIELGLHRSSTRWSPDLSPNPLDVEMRKRTFWSLLTIHVALSGKLGRPMAFRMEDFDVEFPEEMDDDLLSENGLDTSRPGVCQHKIGLHAFQIVPIYLELYNTIYAVCRQPENYISNVSSLESKMRRWQDDLPADLVKGEAGSNAQEGRVYALYAQSWPLEFRLLLRHPSVSMTTDPTFNAESMRVCVESSRQLLGIVRQLQKFKSLDTTWYNSAVYVMAITTTLFAQWEKRGETSAADLAALREEMDIWLEIMADVGALLGAAGRLREAVRVVTDGTLGLLSRSLPSKTQNYVKNKGDSKSPPQKPAPNPNNVYNNTVQQYRYDDNAQANGSAATSGYLPPESQMTHQPTPYPPATQYQGYAEAPAGPQSLSYTQQDAHSYTNYPAPTSDAVDAPLLSAFAAQATQSQPGAPTWRGSPHNANMNSGSQSWQQWTDAMAVNTMAANMEPQDCYSASALMQLGGREMSGVGTGVNVGAPQTSLGEIAGGHTVAINSGVGPLNGQVSGGMGMSWPLNVFQIGQGGPGS